MKIGIITIHKSTVNAGASLQCYALWRYLREKSCDVEVIDLLRESAHKSYKRSKGDKKLSIAVRFRKGIKSLVFLLLGLNKRFKVRRRLFDKFNNKITYSQEFSNIDALYANPPKYDIYISGSDQIWNPLMRFSNKPYLLDFAAEGSKRVAYASSFSIDSLPLDVKPLYKELLERYDSISVRENSGESIVEELLSESCPVVLDPTFLLTKEQWLDLANSSADIKEPYLLVYTLHYDSKIIEMSSIIAKEKGWKLVLTISSERKIRDSRIDEQVFDVGPSQWISLISGAEMVMTNSFHGTVFSMILAKPFLTLLDSKSKLNSRIETLDDKFAISSHFIYNETNYSCEQLVGKAQFDEPRFLEALDSELKISKEYLEDAVIK